MGNHCWREDNQCPATISVNGLTPYQRRVAEERSPDIWEIHEFNNTNPIKIKFLGQSTVDFPAELKVWGIIPSGYNTWEGEMQPDVALNPKFKTIYPFSKLSAPANILIMPAIHSAAISTKLLKELGGSTLIGPLLIGLNKTSENFFDLFNFDFSKF